jgi:hypothetical protein
MCKRPLRLGLAALWLPIVAILFESELLTQQSETESLHKYSFSTNLATRPIPDVVHYCQWCESGPRFDSAIPYPIASFLVMPHVEGADFIRILQTSSCLGFAQPYDYFCTQGLL